MSPKFSIIIPVYNVAPYLRECLDSILAQTYTGWEAICVDDGSTDGSGSILDEYRKIDSRIKVIHQENAGVSIARNVGLDMAQSEWVCFVDADDVVSTFWLESFVDGIRIDADAQLVRVGHKKFSGNVVFEMHAKSIVKYDKYLNEEAYAWGWRVLPEEGFVWSYAIRADILGNTRFCIGVRVAEDTLFSLSILNKISHVVSTGDYTGYNYRQHLASSLKKPVISQERLLFFKECVKILSSDENTHLIANVSREIRKSQTWLVVHNLINWLGWQYDNTYGFEIIDLLKTMYKRDLIDLKLLKLHWRIATFVYINFGCAILLKLTFKFLNRYCTM